MQGPGIVPGTVAIPVQHESKVYSNYKASDPFGTPQILHEKISNHTYSKISGDIPEIPGVDMVQTIFKYYAGNSTGSHLEYSPVKDNLIKQALSATK